MSWKYESGPTGPLDKELNRSGTCPGPESSCTTLTVLPSVSGSSIPATLARTASATQQATTGATTTTGSAGASTTSSAATGKSSSGAGVGRGVEVAAAVAGVGMWILGISALI